MPTILPIIAEKDMNECAANLSSIFPSFSNGFNEIVASTWESVNKNSGNLFL